MARRRTIGNAPPAPRGVRRETIGANGYGSQEEHICDCGSPLCVGDRSVWDTLNDRGPYCSVRCLMSDRERHGG